MVTETDINEDLRTLAQDAENARLYGSPPDAIVLRAIELGMGTRAEIRRSTGFGYDVIEKCLERNSADLSSQMTGEIERFKVRGADDALKPKVEYICVDCGGLRSYGSGQRCKKCFDAKVAQRKIDDMVARGQRPPRTDLDAKDKAHQEAVAQNGHKPRESLHVELGPEEEAVVAAMRDEEETVGYVTFDGESSPKPDPRQGVTYKPLDLQEVEDLMATEETIADAAKKLGLTTSQLSVRRQKDDAVAAAVDRGRRRYYDGLDLKADAEDTDPTCERCGNVAPVFEDRCVDCLTIEQQARFGAGLSKGPEACGCGRPRTHMGRCAYRRAQAGGDFPVSKAAKNGQDAVKVETKPRAEIAQPKPVEVVEPDKKQDKMLDVKMTPQQFIERFNSFDDYEIDEFFTLMNERSAVDNIVWGVLPEEPKHSKQFFSVAYNVLVTMLDDSMTGEQKQSVWSLICYLKRQQKDAFR